MAADASDVEQKIVAAGGVLYRNDRPEPEVVLIYRRGVWDLPKGKKEEGENIPGCAIREVAEEVGIQPPEIQVSLAETWHTYKLEGKLVGKTTHWYAMKTDEAVEFSPEQEEDIEKVAWIPLSKAKTMVGFDNLKQVLESFEQWYTTITS